MKKKQIFKRVDRECYFCGERVYELLDAHRIIPGEKGGKYIRENVLTVCSKCHRKCHTGIIEIKGRYKTSAGRSVVHYLEEGVEKWK